MPYERSNFWAMLGFICGEPVARAVWRACVDEDDNELPTNGVTLNVNTHQSWDAGRLRFDYFANTETSIDLQVRFICPNLQIPTSIPPLPQQQQPPSALRYLAHGDVLRVETDVPLLAPIPPPMVFEVKSLLIKLSHDFGHHTESTIPEKRSKAEPTRKGTRSRQKSQKYAPAAESGAGADQTSAEVGSGRPFKVSGLCRRLLAEDCEQWGFLEPEESESEEDTQEEDFVQDEMSTEGLVFDPSVSTVTPAQPRDASL